MKLTKKNKAGFTLIELMIVVAIIGILAAIAIPNFIKFQARSKQSEPKANLKSMFTAQKAYFNEKDNYSRCIRKIGFSPERGNRYWYNVQNTRLTAEANCAGVELRANAAGVVSPTDSAVNIDTFKYGISNPILITATAVTYAPAVPSGSTGMVVTNDLVGVAPAAGGPLSHFGASAAGNIDSDTNPDLWYISSLSSTTAGICPTLANEDGNVPGGEPKNTYNDVNCP